MDMTKNQIMAGIVRGTPRKSHKPVVDGIVSGVRKMMDPKVGSDIKNVKASATKNAVGQFGGFSGPESDQMRR
jgi:hypothetical protein